MILFKKYIDYLEAQILTVKSGVFSSSISKKYIFNKSEKVNRSRVKLELDVKECTGCLDCEKFCPVNAINIQSEKIIDFEVIPKTSKGDLFKNRMLKLEVDYSLCVFCGYCVEECDTQAINFSKKLPPVGYTKKLLVEDLINKTDGRKK